MATKKNELQVAESKELQTYGAMGVDLGSILAEEMDGLTPSFDRIKIPAGGGISYEIPGEDSESPDTVKEFKAVILYHHPIHCFYKEKYTGGNNPPECGSMDGHIGIDTETGEVKQCADCPNSKFGSGATRIADLPSGQSVAKAGSGRDLGRSGGKACKQKRRIFLLRENEALPTLLSLPTGSLGEYSKYVMRLLSKGKKTNSVVTKFSLKKAQNAGGISYSQAVFSSDRNLTDTEQQSINRMTEQVKALAGRVAVVEEE